MTILKGKQENGNLRVSIGRETLTPHSDPSLYNTTMYAMAALLVMAFFANLLMRPVSELHHYQG